MDQLNKMKKDGDAGEDEIERAEKSLENTTREHVSQIDELLESKESELLTI